ncbi:MAG: ATP-binding protein [Porticoccaceae bacterium]|nr:MAG: ATP-binding protein [Porticoccaceae bacterium]
MPRKTLRRFLPDSHKIVDSRVIRWMGPLFKDPNLFHINRTSISASFFIGLFCAFLPIPGQMIVAALLALSFRTNLPLAMVLIWVSNPLTIAPMFLFSYRIGVLLLGQEVTTLNIELSWDWAIAQSQAIWLPLLTGSLFCGLISGSLAYLTIYQLWRWKVIKNWEARNKRRAQKTYKQEKK